MLRRAVTAEIGAEVCGRSFRHSQRTSSPSPWRSARETATAAVRMQIASGSEPRANSSRSGSWRASAAAPCWSSASLLVTTNATRALSRTAPRGLQCREQAPRPRGRDLGLARDRKRLGVEQDDEAIGAPGPRQLFEQRASLAHAFELPAGEVRQQQLDAPTIRSADAQVQHTSVLLPGGQELCARLGGVEARPVRATLEAENASAAGEAVLRETVAFEELLPQHCRQRGLPGLDFAHDQREPRAATTAQFARLLERHRVLDGDQGLPRGGWRLITVAAQRWLRRFRRRRCRLHLVANRIVDLAHVRTARASSSSRNVCSAISSPRRRIVGSTPWASAFASHSFSPPSATHAALAVRIGSSGPGGAESR